MPVIIRLVLRFFTECKPEDLKHKQRSLLVSLVSGLKLHVNNNLKAKAWHASTKDLSCLPGASHAFNDRHAGQLPAG